MIGVDRAADLSARLELLLDPCVGVIRELQEVPRAAGAPEFFQFAGRACDTGAFARQRNFAATGGAAADPNRAAGKAMGEAVERYCAALYDVDELVLTSRVDAKISCVDPERFALYRGDQYAEPGFSFVPFRDDTPIRWAPAFNAVTGRVQHVPAAAVYVPYFYYQGSGEAPIMEPISTGLACGRSVAEATLGAVCEIIERDAFVLTWQAMIRPPVIDLQRLDPDCADLVRRFQMAALEVWLFDITTDIGVPSVMTVLRSDSPERPALVFAAATAPTAEEATRKSLEEVEHTRRYSQQILDLAPRLEPVDDHENVVDQVDHLNFWCDHANAHLADFLFDGDRHTTLGAIRPVPGVKDLARLRHIVERLADLGHEALLVDLTTEDIEVAGLTVVRAVVPGMHPLCMGHRYRALGGTRLWTVPQRLGHAGIVDHDNPSPHPFP